MVTCVAFSIKFAKTNQKFAENSEFCENHSVLFKIIHWCPYSKPSIRAAPREEEHQREYPREEGAQPRGRHGRGTYVATLRFARDRANLTGLVLGCLEAKFCKKVCV